MEIGESKQTSWCQAPMKCVAKFEKDGKPFLVMESDRLNIWKSDGDVQPYTQLLVVAANNLP